MNKMPYKILISGGGTGGHIFPALSIANALKRRDPNTEILFVGAENRMEMERVPAAGYKIIGLPVCGFDRKRLWRNVKVLFKLWQSMRRARKILRDFQPDIAIGVGGYASGPMLKEVQKKGIPTLLQEQNSYAGVTNKLLAKNAGAICVAYDAMDRFFPAEKIVLTGNPVRANILNCELTQEEAKKQLGFDPQKKLLLIVGGSLGARTINESVANALDEILETGTQVMWQTGKIYIEDYKQMTEDKQGVLATAFISDMNIAYRAADLVVSRAGAGTISELQLLGMPVILVPSPNVAEDHQRKNAQALEKQNAAVMILDVDCRTKLASEVNRLLADDMSRKSLSQNIKKMALINADEKIVDKIYELLKK